MTLQVRMRPTNHPLEINSQMYAYLFLFQHDKNIILLPYKKTGFFKSFQKRVPLHSTLKKVFSMLSKINARLNYGSIQFAIT